MASLHHSPFSTWLSQDDDPRSGRGPLQTRRSVPASGPGATAGQSMSFGEEYVLPGFGFVLQGSDANHEVEHGMDLARSLGEDEIAAHHDRVYLVLRHSSLLADPKQVLGCSSYIGVDPLQCFLIGRPHRRKCFRTFRAELLRRNKRQPRYRTTHNVVGSDHASQARLQLTLMERRGGKMAVDLVSSAEHGGERFWMGHLHDEVVEPGVLACPPLLLRCNLKEDRLRRHLDRRESNTILLAKVAQ